MRPHYYRQTDVALLDISTENHFRVQCWIDGSLGAIEASIQVILQWSLQKRGGLLVHASAGVYEKCGFLIPGPSGVGKSTVAREAGFDIVLSDEMVIVEAQLSESISTSDIQKEMNNKESRPSISYRLFSTPFWSEGRTLPILITDAPLSQLLFPVKAHKAKLQYCSLGTAISKLIGAVTIYEHGKFQQRSMDTQQQASELFDITCQLCSVTPHALLEFPKTGPWIGSLY